MTPARCRKVKARAQPARAKARTEAPVNGGRNYNGPKVNDRAALVKTGQMRENPRILCYPPICNWRVKTHEVRTIRRKDRVGNDSESSETTRQSPAKAGEDIVRTAWRHAEGGRNVHSTSPTIPSSLRPEAEIPCDAGGSTDRHGVLRFAQNDRVVLSRRRNKVERNSLSGKFRPARMA